ncbi:hypothetical protein [Lactococcus kimchii]|uniref:hypothetical protein n=1 Tax=Lactococcus sp. S-13 TaxID=2507158 RepID=UPI001022A231|nr:hypothetical protein [Lactococcus sp. S-13]RZI49604.1 hypothetical protein EQJ87_09305 [Lactococcus sp. S-13]
MFKKHIKTLYFLLVILAVTFLASYAHAEEKATDYSFEVKVTNQGVPAENISIEYENIQIAYQNLKKGIIPDNLKNSSVWKALVSEDQPSLDLGNNLEIGEGVIHTDVEIKQIIRILYETNFDVLQYLNNSEQRYSTNSINNISELISPENKTIPKTNNKGVGRGKSAKGLTAIIQGGSIIDFIKISNQNNTFSIDLSQLKNMVSLKILGIKSLAASDKKTYMVENKQELKYQITISKDIMNQGNELRILTPPNISISLEDSSVPLNVTSLLQEIIPDSYYDDLNINYRNLKSLQGKLVEKVSKNIKENWANVYSYTLPESNEPVVITGNLEIDPQVAVNCNFLFPDGTPFELPILLPSFEQEENSNVNNPSVLKIAAQVVSSDSHRILSVISPDITTGGINFVTIDQQKEKLVKGAQYVLGKKIQDKYYIYSTSGWSEVDKANLFTINPADYVIMSGGFTYNFGNPTPIPLNVDDKNWNQNFESITHKNQSIIDIRGLATDQQYFMMQVTPPKGYSRIEKLNYFKVYKKDGDFDSTPNSIGFAKNQVYELNGKIPGYQAGIMEYNVLSVTQVSKKELNTMKVIFLPILLLISGILITTAILVFVF